MTFRGRFGAGSGTAGTRPGQVSARSGMRACNRPYPIVSAGVVLLAFAIGVFVPQELHGQHSHASAPHAAAPHAPAQHAPAPAQHPSTAPHAQNPASPYPQNSTSPHSNSQPHPPGQQHLEEWMQRNQGLPLQEQINKLHQEPGFNRLTPQQQDKVTNRLEQLNRMPPEQRQRYLERIENMEHLSPDQQAQVRGSAKTLGQMAPDRQEEVKSAIRNLKNVPPGLRQSELSSRYGTQLSPEERGVVSNLLSVESYHPPPPQ
jgi:Protein of unknown function (DUF3106)